MLAKSWRVSVKMNSENIRTRQEGYNLRCSTNLLVNLNKEVNWDKFKEMSLSGNSRGVAIQDTQNYSKLQMMSLLRAWDRLYLWERNVKRGEFCWSLLKSKQTETSFANSLSRQNEFSHTNKAQFSSLGKTNSTWVTSHSCLWKS